MFWLFTNAIASPCGEPARLECDLEDGRALTACMDGRVHVAHLTYDRVDSPLYEVPFGGLVTREWLKTPDGTKELQVVQWSDDRPSEASFDGISCRSGLTHRPRPFVPPTPKAQPTRPSFEGCPEKRAHLQCDLADGRQARLCATPETATYWFGRGTEPELTFSLPTSQVIHTWTSESAGSQIGTWRVPHRDHSYTFTLDMLGLGDDGSTTHLTVHEGAKQVAVLQCAEASGGGRRVPFGGGGKHACGDALPDLACTLDDGTPFSACPDGRVSLGEKTYQGPMQKMNWNPYGGYTNDYTFMLDGERVTWSLSIHNDGPPGASVRIESAPGEKATARSCLPGFRHR